MKRFRITKYNPAYRDEDGSYLKNEWTSMSDMGQVYNNEIFDIKEYFKTEDAYIEAAFIVLNENGITKMFVADLEKNLRPEEDIERKIVLTENEESFYERLSEGISVEIHDISRVIKLTLREIIWCMLYSTEKHFLLKFGYDYYMYIICENISKEARIKIKNLGLFVEEFNLP